MHSETNEYGIKTFSGLEFFPSCYTERKMTGIEGRSKSPADSRWDREVHAAKGIVVENQWLDLEQHCDTSKLKEMALIGPDLKTHLAESKSSIIYPVDMDEKVLRTLRLSLKNMPPVVRQRIPGICEGEYFKYVKFAPFVKEGVNYLDFDSMSIGMKDVVDKMYDGLKAAIEASESPIFIIRITFIDKFRGFFTNKEYLEEILAKLGFVNIPPESRVIDQASLGSHSWIESAEKDYIYKNQGRLCTMMTTQYIRYN